MPAVGVAVTTGYVPVPGTWAEQRQGVQWFDVGSPLDQFLSARGLTNLCATAASAYGWSTDLDFSRSNHYAWQGAGKALFYYLVPQFDPDRRMPPQGTVIASHSHGLQPVLYAAKMGLKIDRFIDISGPVRSDMMEVAKAARPNIRRWMHVHSDRTDYMQILGELFAGNWPTRAHPLADVNVAIPGVGHSGILYDAADFALWEKYGLIDFLLGAPAVAGV